MAKLSAHGTEVARFEKVVDNSRIILSLRSDRHLMRNVALTLDAFGSTRTTYTGWKLYKKMKEGYDLNRVVESLTAAGFTRVK